MKVYRIFSSKVLGYRSLQLVTVSACRMKVTVNVGDFWWDYPVVYQTDHFITPKQIILEHRQIILKEQCYVIVLLIIRFLSTCLSEEKVRKNKVNTTVGNRPNSYKHTIRPIKTFSSNILN